MKSSPVYLPEGLLKACRKYEDFHWWNHGDASEEVVEKSSLMVAGWADAIVWGVRSACYPCFPPLLSLHVLIIEFNIIDH